MGSQLGALVTLRPSEFVDRERVKRFLGGLRKMKLMAMFLSVGFYNVNRICSADT